MHLLFPFLILLLLLIHTNSLQDTPHSNQPPAPLLQTNEKSSATQTLTQLIELQRQRQGKRQRQGQRQRQRQRQRQKFINTGDCCRICPSSYYAVRPLPHNLSPRDSSISTNSETHTSHRRRLLSFEQLGKDRRNCYPYPSLSVFSVSACLLIIYICIHDMQT
jgi:hypothetical protein